MKTKSYTIRIRPEAEKRLKKRAEQLRMTRGDTIEYLLDQERKQIDYFDYAKLNELLNRLDAGTK